MALTAGKMVGSPTVGGGNAIANCWKRANAPLRGANWSQLVITRVAKTSQFNYHFSERWMTGEKNSVLGRR